MGVITLVLLVTVAVEGRILCPEIGLLGAPTNLTCIEASRSHSFLTPKEHTAASCNTSTGKCITTGIFTASVHNTTSSVLTIPALLKSYAGAWKCSSDGDMPDPPSCQMTVAKFPTCTITRRQYDDSDFTRDEEVALKVNVTGDYCSESAQFQLQTGNIQTGLNYSQWKENTDVIFTLTESHLGEVKLVFICRGYSQALSCEGIQQLKFPTCTITRRQYDDSDFTRDEEVALKVNVTGDYCSESAQFQLQTGNIQTGLNYSQWKENTDVIFTLTESHLGEVKLVFICRGYSQALSCEGIQQLRLVYTFDDDSTGGKEEHCRSTVIIAGTVGVVVIVINVLAVIVCLRRHHCQNRQPPVGYLGAVYAPGSAASDYGYATVDDVGYASGQYLPPTVD
ncbi:uncharacterized protein LOC124255900 [Haliotis rubra]|uniref:uncharacterized protein LOC124255900 n=1 Tax=Haliotis rubra TaxID=36100 RepID=UPI001EE5E7A9|nr:uncharacterized protein LOC124255900 [Haliotis rubra]